MKTIFTIVFTVIFIQSQSQNIWSGGSYLFTKTAVGQEDCITPNVCLTRYTRYPLYNSVSQSYDDVSGNCNATPDDTEWAFGVIEDWNSLSYENLFDLWNCNPNSYAEDNTMVCHLISDDIYFEITFSYWENSAGGGDFTYTRTDGLLPIELAWFEVEVAGESVKLSWQTISETNNSGFEIQHSRDGSDWKMLGFEEGQGTITQAWNYTFLDSNPYFGGNYYRLKQIDYDGGFSFSPIRQLSFRNDPSELIALHPNPTSGRFKLGLHNPFSEDAFIRLYDSKGILIWNNIFNQTDQEIYWEQEFDLPQRNVYFVMTQVGNRTETKKIVVTGRN